MVIVVVLGTAWAGTYMSGGTSSALPHAFYLPIVLAAVRFGPKAALLTAIAAGLLCGPIMPQDVATGDSQSVNNWLTRLAFFAAVGVVTAYLCRPSLPWLREDVAARRFRRDLSGGITRGELRVVYQPIVSLPDGRLAGVEALVRWHHPTRGVVPPGEFISQAEQSGSIGCVTRFVLAEACGHVATWREGHLRDRDQFTVAVNVSAVDLADPTFAHVVERVLADTGLPSSWLHLEITETALVNDVASAVAAVVQLRALGVQMAIDDFGTGESSLSYLDRFPVDTLKIDRMFVRRLSSEHHGDPLTHGIVALARALSLDVIAEGVETEDQARAVLAFGCELAQGFLFSKPRDGDQMESLLTTSAPFAVPGC